MLRPGGNVVGEQGKVPAPMGPRQNPSHQLEPSVGIHNSPRQLSEHASESPRSPDHCRRVDRGKTKVHDDEVLLDHQSSNSNYAPSRTGGKSKHTRCRHDQSLSEDSNTREPSYRPRYDLTPSDSSPERSPVRENRPVHKGKVTSEDRKVDKEGHLLEFVKTDQRGSPWRYKEPSPRKYFNDRGGNDRSPHVMGGGVKGVDTISGGIVGGGDTSNARRKYARMAVYTLGSSATTHDM
ncbi:hypothetical protein LIER_06767 [Lithospermum erythrorhizon]|uniref:Uncharacterized protein n=1 Tax=Lithospermum erythrorhizon TaxID=34254 RepID=A0AAV3PA22_LITER